MNFPTAILILFSNLAPFFHLWSRKLGPFHKHAARPSLMLPHIKNLARAETAEG